MSSKVKIGFPYDEAMRAEHGESVVRPLPNVTSDPADDSDRGPHVDRVGMVAVDSDCRPDDEDPPPEPIVHEPDA